ncbi:MAG TPA: pyridoxamine 5'-phosphate oxidase family protein [Chloroflexota bacterium]|jgi:nitroimidazol reductase NimA-like FMN-containing flavoprotein (pyridoxamine 5'-phosphate oxidase superfamily)|nr:pyridoxamine 5'-phosphate oxidase family protein [Chloroflexota bacterium]
MDERGGPLTPAELDEFLNAPRLLKLACLRPDGWPYVVPLWYVWLERRFYVIGRERAAWVGFVRESPRVGILVDEEERQHRRLQATGLARIVEGPSPLGGRSERWREVGRRMGALYMADARGQAYAQLTAERPRYLVEIEPVQITTWRGGLWHRRYYAPTELPPPPTAVPGG